MKILTLVLILLTTNVVIAEDYVYPLMDTDINSQYGKRVHPIKKITRHHSGIDLAAARDTPIRAIASGTVIYADPHGGFGNYISILHDQGGISSHYAHCQEIKVKTGHKVKAGEIIGTVGSTGASTGPHLHFEIRKDGKALDPYKLFPNLAAKAEG